MPSTSTALATDPPPDPPDRPPMHPRLGRAELGRFGEDLAVRYLADSGLVVLERNWRCPAGEVDVVAMEPGADGLALVVVEVKTRQGVGFGRPAEGVTVAKLARLRRLAALWLQAHPRLHVASVRIDVVGILRPRSGPAQVEHLRGVI